MQRKRGELVPIGEVVADLDGPVQAIRDTSPQALHHFTQADQVNQLVTASETTPDLGFMARMMALCSLPRTNPGNRTRYVRRNGPYTLVMNAGGRAVSPPSAARCARNDSLSSFPPFPPHFRHPSATSPARPSDAKQQSRPAPDTGHGPWYSRPTRRQPRPPL